MEIGIPFSDPIAEGVVIQNANIRALKAGATTERVFEMVSRVRRRTQIPLVFLTYLNPVFHYGYEKFFARCQDVGIDGIIIPDLPFEEKGEVAPLAAACGVDVISMIAPTSSQRIERIAGEAAGFLYVVSSMGVTGVRKEITTDLEGMLGAVRKATDLPAAVGFGISTPEQAAKIDQALSMMQTMELMKELQNAPGQEDFMNAMFGAFQAQDPEGEPNAPTGSKEGAHPERRRDDRRELDEQSEPEAY